MHTRQISNLTPPALLIGALLTLATQPAFAQSIHRAKAQITIGPTVQVSKAFFDSPHYENLAAGDAAHPGRLITCSMVDPQERARLWYQYCYVSFDGGESWEPTLKVAEGWLAADPIAVYGHGDILYAVALVIKVLDKPKDSDPDVPGAERKTVVYKSGDGGRTWNESGRFQFIDREFIGIDLTNGKYDGRLYIAGQGSVQGIDGARSGASLQLFRSLDDGKTFNGPVQAAHPIGTTLYGAAVLSDGTFVVLFHNGSLSPPGKAELHIISSKDGGETFGKSVKITDAELRGLGQLAVDPGSKLFKDRLYALFPAVVSDRIQIQLSYSADKGKTWSKPVIVNDDRSPEEGNKGPDHLLPSVAVSRDGVVLVTWYDRREAVGSFGWRLRAATSLDGGETFSTSVPVTEVAHAAYTQTTPWDISVDTYRRANLLSLSVGIDTFALGGGHTSGLAVDADGTFHPTWTDNRTGVAQLWTAPVKVSGTVVKNGAADLAQLEDISESVTFEISKRNFDPKTGTLSLTTYLKNITKNTVEGPVKVRVLTLESQLGVPEITNADNHQNGTGAVWDFTAQLPDGTLPSMKPSAPKTLTFRIADVRTPHPGKDFKRGLLALDMRVLGKLRKEKTDKRRTLNETPQMGGPLSMQLSLKLSFYGCALTTPLFAMRMKGGDE